MAKNMRLKHLNGVSVQTVQFSNGARIYIDTHIRTPLLTNFLVFIYNYYIVVFITLNKIYKMYRNPFFIYYEAVFFCIVFVQTVLYHATQTN